MKQRAFLAAFAACLARAAVRLPAEKHVKWAVRANLWNPLRKGPLTEVFMRDTGFIGIRLTEFPGIVKAMKLQWIAA